MIALACVDSCRDLAVLAVDQAQMTGDPQWFATAEHLIRALHALALVETGVGVEDDGDDGDGGDR